MDNIMPQSDWTFQCSGLLSHVCLSVYLSVCVRPISVRPSAYLSVRLSFSSSLRPSVRPPSTPPSSRLNTCVPLTHQHALSSPKRKNNSVRTVVNDLCSLAKQNHLESAYLDSYDAPKPVSTSKYCDIMQMICNSCCKSTCSMSCPPSQWYSSPSVQRWTCDERSERQRACFAFRKGNPRRYLVLRNGMLSFSLSIVAQLMFR